MEVAGIVLSALAGSIMSTFMSCLPGVHVYSLLAVSAIAMSEVHHFPSTVFVPFYAGLITGYSLSGIIPAVLLSAPDESALFAASPGRKYLKHGRGYEAVMLMAFGGLAGLLWLCSGAAALSPILLGMIISVLRPHMHWIVWCVIAFMLMSEWPKQGRYAYGACSRLADAWLPLLAGWAAFLLSGLLGILLFLRSPICLQGSFQNLMPAFAGLFTMPWLVVNLFSISSVPAQEFKMEQFQLHPFSSGAVAGIAGGSLAAILPGVTGGVGGLVAGHAVALRDDKAFLVSQGASRAVYYVGSLLLLFVPALNITRGGGAALMQVVYLPYGFTDYYMFFASVAAAAAASLMLLDPLVRFSVRLVSCLGYRRIAACGIMIVTASVFIFTGLAGLLVMFVSLCIGLIPILYGVRRMNCLGIVLLPIAILIT